LSTLHTQGMSRKQWGADALELVSSP